MPKLCQLFGHPLKRQLGDAQRIVHGKGLPDGASRILYCPACHQHGRMTSFAGETASWEDVSAAEAQRLVGIFKAMPVLDLSKMGKAPAGRRRIR